MSTPSRLLAWALVMSGVLVACGAAGVPSGGPVKKGAYTGSQPTGSGTTCPPPAPWTPSDAEPFDCVADSDCTRGIRPRCGEVPVYRGPGKPRYAGRVRTCLADPCLTDGECGPGFLCYCGTGIGGVNQCGPGDCRADSDCPSGACAEASHRPWLASLPPPNYAVKYCRTPRDTCRADTDCGRDACEFLSDRFECVPCGPPGPACR